MLLTSHEDDVALVDATVRRVGAPVVPSGAPSQGAARVEVVLRAEAEHRRALGLCYSRDVAADGAHLGWVVAVVLHHVVQLQFLLHPLLLGVPIEVWQVLSHVDWLRAVLRNRSDLSSNCPSGTDLARVSEALHLILGSL